MYRGSEARQGGLNGGVRLWQRRRLHREPEGADGEMERRLERSWD